MTPEEKEKSPNAAIDKAIKKLMKSLATSTDTVLAPDEIKAHVAVLATAMKWEQIKHSITDGEAWNPDSI
jgi:hypothetical protein